MRRRTHEQTAEVREPQPGPPVGQWTTTVTRTAALKLSNGLIISVDKIEGVLPITDPDTGESLGCTIEMVSGKTHHVDNPADVVLDAWLGPKIKP